MTTRHAGYVVVLADDIREDDAQATISAIEQLRGVLTVRPITNEVSVSMIAKTRVRHQLAEKLGDLARALLDDKEWADG